MKRLTCKETTFLVSQGLDRALSWNDRLSVRFHLFICEACARFKRQSEFLRAAVRHGAAQWEQAIDATLSAPARERIQRALREDDA